MGASKTRRLCPAVNHDITSAECGESRICRYACPAACQFNPFSPANYDAQLEIEDRVDAMTMQRFAHESQGPAAELLEQIRTAERNGSGHVHAAAVWKFFYQRDRVGLTFAERWRAAGFPGF